MNAVATIVRGLQLACALTAFGTLVLLQLLPRVRNIPFANWRRSWLCIGSALTAAAALLGVGVLALQATTLDASAPFSDVAAQLLRETRFGRVWMARESLMLLACALSAFGAKRGNTLLSPWALAAMAGALVAAPLSGHTAAVQPAWPALCAHAVHLAAVGAWWGALPALVALLHVAAHTGGTEIAAQTFRRFSSTASWLMLAIFGSGVVLAVTHVESWPALFATRYGQLLLAKLALLACVLTLAATLRWRLLPAVLKGDKSAAARRSARWIAAECCVGASIVALAVELAQTIPAHHADIEWWLPFRMSLVATWDLPGTPVKVWSAVALSFLAVALVLLGALGIAPRRKAQLAAALMLGAAVALGVPALSVQAFPDTYRKPGVPYQTLSVAAGAQLYALHCTACHGRSAHGDGEQRRGLPLPPADLTEPHTALHTAGDIYWWLIHGKPPGAMPGFGTRLSEDDRWDLINFLRTLSAGYQARIIGERVVGYRPWLGAIDFNFVDQHGRSATLKNLRGKHAVLLVLFSPASSAQRLRQIGTNYPRLRAAGAEVIAVPVRALTTPLDPMPFPVAVEGATETAQAYGLLRRTLTDADARDAAPIPEHMELLVDRFGYIRARWLPKEGPGWSETSLLLTQLQQLDAEPQIRPPPDDHVH